MGLRTRPTRRRATRHPSGRTASSRSWAPRRPMTSATSVTGAPSSTTTIAPGVARRRRDTWLTARFSTRHQRHSLHIFLAQAKSPCIFRRKSAAHRWVGGILSSAHRMAFTFASSKRRRSTGTRTRSRHRRPSLRLDAGRTVSGPGTRTAGRGMSTLRRVRSARREVTPARRLATASVLLIVPVAALPMGLEASRTPVRGCGWSHLTNLAMRGSLRADLDGDRRQDDVAVVARYSARRGCRFALRLQAATGKTSFLRLPDPVSDASAAVVRRQPWPRLTALALIDRRPGAEAVVTVHEGASTGFVRLFTVRRHLTALRVAAPGMRDSFAYGAGGVGAGVDCWPRRASGSIVASEAFPRPSGWIVRRVVYRLRGTVFYRSRTSVRRVTTVRRFPELWRPIAFPSCSIRRGRN